MSNPTLSASRATAAAAIRAAQNMQAWGFFAARRYAAKRGASFRLVMLAASLEAGLI